MKIQFIALAVSLCLLPLFAAPDTAGPEGVKKMTVAVADLEGRGLAEGEAFTLTDALRNYLLNTGAFRVMERGKMDLILKEQGFQQSGACTDQACLVEMGQLLGVDHLITGSIGKVGGTYSTNIRMININTGEIVRTANKFYKGEIDGLLTKIIPEIAQEFASVEEKAAPAPKQAAAAPAAKQAAAAPAPSQPEKEVKEKKGGGHPVLWVALGAVAVGGGVATYLILNKKDDEPAPKTGGLEVTW